MFALDIGPFLFIAAQCLTSKYPSEKNLSFTDIIDAYRNLVLKGVSWMEWTVTNCPSAKWIVKVDDDIAVNIFALEEYLEEQNNTKNEYHCLVWTRMKPSRNSNSKW